MVCLLFCPREQLPCALASSLRVSGTVPERWTPFFRKILRFSGGVVMMVVENEVTPKPPIGVQVIALVSRGIASLTLNNLNLNISHQNDSTR